MTQHLLKYGLIFSTLLTISSLAQAEQPRPRPRPNPPPGQPQPPNAPPPGQPTPPPDNVEQRLNDLVVQLNLTAIDRQQLGLPNINDTEAQLGKQLFFTKNLGGDQSAACASCHHPSLGGGDSLSLPVGVDAVDMLSQSNHNLLGQGRFNGGIADNIPTVARNAPTVFNTGLNTRGLFWDSRVERLRNGEITTPDSGIDDNGRRLPDRNLSPGSTLAAAQARFPVVSADEMRANFASDADNQAVREGLAQRFDNSDDNFISNWPAMFAQVFSDNEINFNRIAEAIGEYERSMVFVDSPWNRYLQGQQDALDEQQKAGAVLFFTPPQQGGAGCVRCHSGPTFSDNRHHLVAFPQIGLGKGNASNTSTSQDYGRENITGNIADRYHFRTPSLLNVAATAPYGHSGAYQTLEQVVQHYNNPRGAIDRLFAAQGGIPFSNSDAAFCRLPQIADLMVKNNQRCQDIFPDAYANSIEVVDHLRDVRDGIQPATSPLPNNIRLSPQQVTQVVAFLQALTDPCLADRNCLAPWIIDQKDQASFPDDQPLLGHDKDGNAL